MSSEAAGSGSDRDAESAEDSKCLEERWASVKPQHCGVTCARLHKSLCFLAQGINPCGFAHRLLWTVTNLVSEYGLRVQALR